MSPKMTDFHLIPSSADDGTLRGFPFWEIFETLSAVRARFTDCIQQAIKNRRLRPQPGTARLNKKPHRRRVWNFCVTRYVLSSLSIADDDLLIAAKNQFVDIRALDVSPLHGLSPLSEFYRLIIELLQPKNKGQLYIIYKENVNKVCKFCVGKNSLLFCGRCAILAKSISDAGVVQWQNVSFPS